MGKVYRRVVPMKAIRDGRFLGKEGFILQRKYDGSRAIAFRDGDKIILRGASWKRDYTDLFPLIVADLKRTKARRFILDAELTFFKGEDDKFMTVFAKEDSLKARGLKPRLMVFDILELDGRSVKEKPVEERVRLLKKIIPANLKHVRLVKTYTDHKKFKMIFANITRKQGEGVILKAKGSQYLEGKKVPIRSEEWVKVKKRKDADCVIVGITKGLGWRKPWFGALILAQYNHGKLVHVANASGFDRDTMKSLYETIKKMSATANPFKHQVRGAKKFVKPRLVCVVTYMERTPYGILRHPIFVMLRQDKPPRECTIGGDIFPTM